MKKYWFFLVIFLLEIPLILPFFHRGFFPSHDDIQVVRIFEMTQSLRFGDIPPRWSANLLYGYGYPLYIFYSSLPYLLGAVASFLGANFLISTKLIFILSFFLGSGGIYFLAKEWWGPKAALGATIAYSLAPYRAVDVYVRGNLAEFFSFSLFPWVFFFNWKVLNQDREKKIPWELIFCFSLFCLAISHNISFFIFSFFLVIFNLYFLFFHLKNNRLKIFINLSLICFLSFSLSAFYLIPLLYENKFVIVSQFLNSNYWDYFLTLKKLWSSPWGWGGYTDLVDAV